MFDRQFEKKKKKKEKRKKSFLNISTKAAYIPAKLCDVRVIYLNKINILNSYFKQNRLQFTYKEKTFSAVQKRWVFSELYEKY